MKKTSGTVRVPAGGMLKASRRNGHLAYFAGSAASPVRLFQCPEERSCAKVLLIEKCGGTGAAAVRSAPGQPAGPIEKRNLAVSEPWEPSPRAAYGSSVTLWVLDHVEEEAKDISSERRRR